MKNKIWETHEYKFYTTHDLFINGKIIESFTYYKGKVNILGNFLIDCGLSESTGDLELDRLMIERKVLLQCKDEIKNLQDIVDGLEN
jgi:hypothetical protein